ncbi:MAG: hypothetical protein ACI86H_001845 [bacterium]|jgi:hypothetical protein
MIAGVSRFFSWKGFILTIIVATFPIPLLAYFGFIQIEQILNL